MEFSFNLLLSIQAWFWYALFLMLAILTSCLTLKSPTKHKLIEKPATPKLPPGPQPWPLVGSLPEMVANKPVFRWIDKLMSAYNTDILCLRLGNVHVVPVSCPRIACEFLKKQDANFASRPLSMAAELISRGYLTTALVPFGKQWKKMKKVVSNELVSPMRLQWLHDKRAQEADNLVRYVYSLCNNNNDKKEGLVNLRFVSQQYCGDVIRKMIFNKRYFGEGGKDGGPGFEEEEHVEAIFKLLRFLYAFCVSDYMPCLRVFDFDGHEKRLTKALEIIKKYHDPIIDDRIQQWRDGRKEVMEDLLDVLISLKDADHDLLLTPKEIKATIIDVMNATVDNPSNALEWAIAEMLNKPELLERATQELDSVVGKHRLVQESDLPKLNYIKACAREAFRLHPVAPFIPPHLCMADTVVAGHFIIPKGSHVILSRRRLGRNPRIWEEDPDQFKPDRHLKRQTHHDADDDDDDVCLSLTEPDLRFVSFSIGRRGCPGVALGSSITLMLFAKLLQCFTWSVPCKVSGIDLSESNDDLSLAVPLVATAKPRLAAEVFLSANEGV